MFQILNLYKNHFWNYFAIFIKSNFFIFFYFITCLLLLLLLPEIWYFWNNFLNEYKISVLYNYIYWFRKTDEESKRNWRPSKLIKQTWLCTFNQLCQMWSLLCTNINISNPEHSVPDLSKSCHTLNPHILKWFWTRSTNICAISPLITISENFLRMYREQSWGLNNDITCWCIVFFWLHMEIYDTKSKRVPR